MNDNITRFISRWLAWAGSVEDEMSDISPRRHPDFHLLSPEEQEIALDHLGWKTTNTVADP